MNDELKLFAAKCAIVGATVVAVLWLLWLLDEMDLYHWTLFGS